ncbi:MAG: hypothetical protein ACLRZH_19170 [Ruthenibacterium lactatiformans]
MLKTWRRADAQRFSRGGWLNGFPLLKNSAAAACKSGFPLLKTGWRADAQRFSRGGWLNGFPLLKNSAAAAVNRVPIVKNMAGAPTHRDSAAAAGSMRFPLLKEFSCGGP